MSSTTDQSPKVDEMFEQAARLFESAIHAGIKVQEESVRSLSELMMLGSAAGWQKRSQEVMERSLATSQKNFDEAIEALNQNAKTSLEILQRAFECRRDESGADVQARTKEMWETTIGSLRKNTEVMLQANRRVVDCWREITRIMRGESGDRR